MSGKTAVIAGVAGILILAALSWLLRPEPDVEPFTFEVSGESMLPTMHPGDLAYAERIPWGELEAGMIATTIDGVVHRLGDKHPLGWVTVGDNNPASDRFVMTRKDYEAVVLYWQTHDGDIVTPEYAERFLE